MSDKKTVTPLWIEEMGSTEKSKLGTVIASTCSLVSTKKRMKFIDLTPFLISQCMNIEIKHLFQIARNVESYFRPTREEKTKSGKIRVIDEPKGWLKLKLKALHDLLQRSKLYHQAAHGGVRGRSCFTAARHHLGKKAVATRDITDCYPSITKEQFRQKMLDMGFRTDTAFLLSGLLTCRNRIPQGSPTSNDALNLYLFDIDVTMTKLADDTSSYTRNADDHVVSGNNKKYVDMVVCELEKEIENRKLVVSVTKKEKNGLKLSPDVQLVHAIGVNHPACTRINKEYAKSYIECGNKYVKLAENLTVDSLEEVALLRRTLLGMINYSKQADISPVKRLSVLLRTGDHLVLKKLVAENITRSKKWWVKNKKRNRPAEIANYWMEVLKQG